MSINTSILCYGQSRDPECFSDQIYTWEGLEKKRYYCNKLPVSTNCTFLSKYYYCNRTTAKKIEGMGEEQLVHGFIFMITDPQKTGQNVPLPPLLDF